MVSRRRATGGTCCCSLYLWATFSVALAENLFFSSNFALVLGSGCHPGRFWRACACLCVLWCLFGSSWPYYRRRIGILSLVTYLGICGCGGFAHRHARGDFINFQNCKLVRSAPLFSLFFSVFTSRSIANSSKVGRALARERVNNTSRKSRISRSIANSSKVGRPLSRKRVNSSIFGSRFSS